jgi:hypothetical protein
MVISPVVRGLFGLEWDAAGKKLTVTPSLPADWDNAKLHHVPFAGGDIDLELTRDGPTLLVRATGSPTVVLASHAPGAKWTGNVLRIPLPAVETALSHDLPPAGSTTQQLKVLDQQYSTNSLLLRLSAPANSQQAITLRINDMRAKLNVEGAQMRLPGGKSLYTLQLNFGPGEGYVEKTVKFTW